MSCESPKRLKLIEASAGTGKTQELAERLIALLGTGVKPQELVALTFSRDAAGEIFERFVTLLAAKAERNPEKVARLREVIATQHLSQIGTLDSFLMKIVRAFPLEFGLSGSLEMLDDYRLGRERAKVAFSILRGTDDKIKKHFAAAFALAMDGADVRSFIDSYNEFIREWHRQVVARGEATAWGIAEVIWPHGAPVPIDTAESDLAAAAAALDGIVDDAKWRELQSWISSFRGSFSGSDRGMLPKFLELDDLLTRDALEIKFNRKTYSFSRDQTVKIQRAFAAVFGFAIRQKLALARGVYALITAFEREYARRVRGRGRLVFDDVPRLLAQLDPDKRLSLEFRMDSRFRAWALDEFQDTSRGQWAAIANLIDEAKQDEEKSLFVVGDRKQAIYGWREGDVRIFEHEKADPLYGEPGELVKSWRFGPSIAEAVNRVFADGCLAREFPGWECPRHETAKPDMADFVQVVQTERVGVRAGMADFIEPVANALRAVDPVGRRLSAAVLVRGNGFGRALADGLKRAGLTNVVFEGESEVAGTVALAGFLDLVELADHPCDTPVYRHFAMTPLAAAKYPGGVPKVEELSREMSEAFTTRGLVRVFRELRALLPKSAAEAWSEFTESQYNEMLRAASEFDLTRESDTRASDFWAFLAARTRRNLAEPGRIKVLTIHRSKGLGFDYVALPLYEYEGIDGEPSGPLLGEDWILPNPGGKAVSRIDGLAEVRDERMQRSLQETLCVYYVAMTRAKRGLSIFLNPQTKGESKSRRFSDIVRERLGAGCEIGDREWYLKTSVEQAQPPTAERLETPPRERRQRIRRRTPSKTFHSGMSAAELFAPAARGRAAAAERGSLVHAEYAGLEFLAPADAQTPLDRELLKPDGFVALWRERPFELCRDGEWISGRFDRVVFTETEGVRRAKIYDYKTNRRLRGESDEDFAARLRALYRPQLEVYRRAVAAMTDLAEDRIECLLLALDNKTVIKI